MLIPSEEKASDVFRRMFFQGTADEIAKPGPPARTGPRASSTRWPARRRDLQRSVGARDRDRLDQYFTSVRELEQRMDMSREWERKPKPVVKAPFPLDPAGPHEYMEKVNLMYDMARLAFETDSTRSVALLLDSVNSPAIEIEA